MAKYRKQPLTEKRAIQVGESYRLMYVLSAMMQLEYDNYMDTDFRNPQIHMEIGKMKKSIGVILNKHKLAIGNTESLDAVEFTNNLLQVLKDVVNPKADD